MGFSQAQLARAVGVTFQQIQKYENGNSQLTPERLVALARELEVPVDFFFRGLPGEAAGEPLLVDRDEADAQMLALVRSYGRIAEGAWRRSFLRLVMSVSESDLDRKRPPAC